MLRRRLKTLGKNVSHLFSAHGAKLLLSQWVATQAEHGEVIHPANFGRNDTNIIARQVDRLELLQRSEALWNRIDAVLVGGQSMQAGPAAHIGKCLESVHGQANLGESRQRDRLAVRTRADVGELVGRDIEVLQHGQCFHRIGDESPPELVLAGGELGKGKLRKDFEWQRLKGVFANVENPQARELPKVRGKRGDVVAMKIQNLELLQLRKAWIEGSVQEVTAQLQVPQGRNLADHLQAVVGEPVLRLRKVSNWSFTDSVRAYQVERGQHRQPPEAHGQGDQHVSVQVKGLETCKDIALAVLIFSKHLGIDIRKDRIGNHLQLVVGGDEPGQINALRPRSARLSDQLGVVHVHDGFRNFPQTHGSNVQPAAGPGRLQTSLQDFRLRLIVTSQVEGVTGKPKIECVVSGNKGWFRSGFGQRI